MTTNEVERMARRFEAKEQELKTEIRRQSQELEKLSANFDILWNQVQGIVERLQLCGGNLDAVSKEIKRYP